MRLHLILAVVLSAAAVLLSLAPGGSAAAQGPFLGVFPNPTTDRHVTAFGSDFCAAPACSTVAITIDERVAATGIQVGPEGKFEIALTITEPAGNYTVTASQTNARGALISAQARLSVMAQDFIEPTPTPAGQGTPPPGGASPTPLPTASQTPQPGTPTPGADVSPTPIRTGGPSPTPATSPGPSEQADENGTSPWLLAAIAAAAAAALLTLALAFRRARRR